MGGGREGRRKGGKEGRATNVMDAQKKKKKKIATGRTGKGFMEKVHLSHTLKNKLDFFIGGEGKERAIQVEKIVRPQKYKSVFWWWI